jgi:hypothetical protein
MTIVQWDILRDAKCRWAYWYMGFKLHISTATNERFERSLGGLLSAAENTVSAALKLFALDMIDYLPDSNAFQILYIGERLSMVGNFVTWSSSNLTDSIRSCTKYYSRT